VPLLTSAKSRVLGLMDMTGEFGIKILDDPGIWLKKKTSKPWEQNHHNGQNWLDVHAEQQLWL